MHLSLNLHRAPGFCVNAGFQEPFYLWDDQEAIDAFAFFWGMFAIGGSGLLLWFPEFFGHFLPGWIFNVAIIVHSDEALLASGFIFTVHFFNTHFRPGKFPMDMVIPEEGTLLLPNTGGVPVGAKNKRLAFEFLNFRLEKEVQRDFCLANRDPADIESLGEFAFARQSTAWRKRPVLDQVLYLLRN